MKPKQAVILIHGVGEQKPNQTLRSFVQSITTGKKYYNKADHISEIPELRRLQLFGSKYTPPTDCYELYWAHNTQDKIVPIIRYFAKLIFSKTKTNEKLSRHLRILRVASIALSLLAIYSTTITMNSNIAKIAGALIPIFTLYATYRFVYNYMGKASSYLNPSYDTVVNRSRIRTQGIKLLDKIHKSNKYFRVILVGHSLGSVIGYDILTHYWNTIIPNETMIPPKGKIFKAFKENSQVLNDGAKTPGERIELFQQAQHGFWRELRECKFPWLVSDFITLGSPLAHAPALISESLSEFDDRKNEREYPQCPPIDWSNRDLMYQYDISANNTHRAFNRPEHDCLFMCTRWTNIYFDSERLFHGDAIAGPVGGIFGKGIKDVAIPADGELPTCHTKYWDNTESGQHPRAIALQKLLAALRLETKRSRDEWPSP